VHVGRLRNAFNDLGAPSLYRVGLKLLTLLGEVEALFGGYWLMAPFRIVNVLSRFAFVGAVPTVSGFLTQVKHQGLARYIPEESAVRFPVQSIEGWMGDPISSHSAYVRDFIKAHRERAAPALNSPEIEYLTLATERAHSKCSVWSRVPNAVLSREKLAICRQADMGIYRYFSAELSGRSIANEATLHHSINRLTFALAFEAGAPFRAESSSCGSMLDVKVSTRLPLEEFRLSLLLASSIARQAGATTFSIDADLAPLFLRKLRDLGCQLESMP
jgi:hypothetical protein